MRRKTTIPPVQADRQATTKEGMAVPIGKFVEYLKAAEQGLAEAQNQIWEMRRSVDF